MKYLTEKEFEKEMTQIKQQKRQYEMRKELREAKRRFPTVPITIATIKASKLEAYFLFASSSNFLIVSTTSPVAIL